MCSARWPGSCYRMVLLVHFNLGRRNLLFPNSLPNQKYLHWFSKSAQKIVTLNRIKKRPLYLICSIKLWSPHPASIYRRVETTQDPPIAPLRFSKVAEFKPNPSWGHSVVEVCQRPSHWLSSRYPSVIWGSLWFRESWLLPASGMENLMDSLHHKWLFQTWALTKVS